MVVFLSWLVGCFLLFQVFLFSLYDVHKPMNAVYECLTKIERSFKVNREDTNHNSLPVVVGYLRWSLRIVVANRN